MKTSLKKVNRTFDALAVLLCRLPDKTIDNIHAVINDDKDGYFFNFKSAVEKYRRLLVK